MQNLEEVVAETISRSFDGTWPSEFLKCRDLHRQVVNQAEKSIVRYALERCNYNQVHAARVLGINRTTLRSRMARYGLLIKRS